MAKITYNPPSGRGPAIASLIIGIASMILALIGFWLWLVTPVIGIIAGIVGICLASSARSHGYTGGMRTAGLVLNILGLIFSIIMLITDLSCAACLGLTALL